MKKFLFLLFNIVVVCPVMSDDYCFESKTPYGIYGFEQVFNEDFYQDNYVGKPFTFLPSRTERVINEYLELSKSDEGEKFIFTKFKSKDDGDSDMDLILYFRPEKSSLVTQKKVSVYHSNYSVLGLPFVDEEKVNKEIKMAIGHTYSHPDAKNVYTITDAKFEYFDDAADYKSVVYYINDNISGDTFRISNMNTTHEELDSAFYKKDNVMRLERIERDGQPQENQAVDTNIDGDVSYMVYKDSLLQIRLYPLNTTFGITLENLSSNTMKLIWDEAVFVSTSGISDNVIHSGIRYIEKEKSQMPTTVIRGATIKDCISPKSNSKWINGKTNFSWKFGYGFTTEYTPGYWAVEELYPVIVEKPLYMQIMLPIQMKEVVMEYIFDIKYYHTFSFPYTKAKDE